MTHGYRSVRIVVFRLPSVAFLRQCLNAHAHISSGAAYLTAISLTTFADWSKFVITFT